MKSKIKLLLQNLFGFERYLYYFSLFKIRTLKWDRNENDIFLFIDYLKKLNSKGIVLDLGANIGIMTGIIAQKTDLKIQSFEPLPVNFGVLNRIVIKLKLQSRVQLHKIALGNEDGICEMVLPMVDKVRMHGLSHVIDPTITEFNDGQITEQIPMKKLDNITFNEKILGIKLDVENYEFNVLKGAETILVNQKPIIYIELWDNQNRTNCFNYLRSLGYKSYYNNKGNLTFFDKNITSVQTFFFIG